MTVTKRHSGKNKAGQPATGICREEHGKCPYKTQEGSRHFYYDSTIRAEVLPPNETLQILQNSQSVESLHDDWSEKVKTREEADVKAYTKHYSTYEKAQAAHEAITDKLLKKAPVQKENFINQLDEAPEGENMIGEFDISQTGDTYKELPSSITDKDKIEFAESFLKLQKAEENYRSQVSALSVTKGYSI